jgi:6,7-dimethyl-8-ribityllumazine synthase
MAEHLANAFIRPKKKAHLLIIEARFHDVLADALLEGAQLAINEAHCTFDVVTVPGALEIPAIISFALVAEAEGGVAYDGFVALGAIIRGDTYHFDIVANESSRALMDLSVQESLAIGNGILTTENEEQAWVRARRAEGDKGGFAARAALTMIAHRERFAAGAQQS